MIRDSVTIAHAYTLSASPSAIVTAGIVTAASHIRSATMHPGDAPATRNITVGAARIAMSLTMVARVMSASVGRVVRRRGMAMTETCSRQPTHFFIIIFQCISCMSLTTLTMAQVACASAMACPSACNNR